MEKSNEEPTKEILEQKYRAFLKYDFMKDEKYRQYIDGIYPEPTLLNLRSYQKKFYKKYIDPTFDVSYIPPGYELKSTPLPKQQDNASADDKTIENIQMFLCAAFIFSIPMGIIFKSHYPNLALAGAFLVSLLSKHGIPQLNKEWWRLLILDDDLNNLVSVGVCFVNFWGTMILYIPLIIIAACKVAQRVDDLAKRGNMLAGFVNKITKKIAINSDAILDFKADLDIYVGFYILLGLVMWWVPVLLPLLYWQLMQIRYIIYERHHKAFDKMGAQIDGIITHPKCPTPLRFMLSGLKNIAGYFSRMVAPQEQPKEEEKKQNNEEVKKTTETEEKTDTKPKTE